MNSWMCVSEPKIEGAPWSRPTKESTSSARNMVPLSQAAGASPVTSIRVGATGLASVMTVSVRSGWRCQQVVVVDNLFQRGDPVVVVLPAATFDLWRVLPSADGFDQALLEIAPVIVAELR